jgi:hypothetical protein
MQLRSASASCRTGIGDDQAEVGHNQSYVALTPIFSKAVALTRVYLLRRSTCCGAERALCGVGDGIVTRPFSACKLIDPKPGACTTRRSREANHRSCQSSAWALVARRRAVRGIGSRRALSRRGTNLQGKAGDRGCAPAPSGTGPNDFAIRHTCGFTTALKSSSEGFHLLWWQPAKCAGGNVVCRSSPCCFFRFPRVCFLWAM